MNGRCVAVDPVLPGNSPSRPLGHDAACRLKGGLLPGVASSRVFSYDSDMRYYACVLVCFFRVFMQSCILLCVRVWRCCMFVLCFFFVFFKCLLLLLCHLCIWVMGVFGFVVFGLFCSRICCL